MTQNEFQKQVLELKKQKLKLEKEKLEMEKQKAITINHGLIAIAATIFGFGS